MVNQELIKSNYRCAKCHGTDCIVGGLAATGKGLSKIFDIQVNKFTTVSCTKCGYTEFFNDNISGRLDGSDWLDIFFGG